MRSIDLRMYPFDLLTTTIHRLPAEAGSEAVIEDRIGSEKEHITDPSGYSDSDPCSSRRLRFLVVVYSIRFRTEC